MFWFVYEVFEYYEDVVCIEFLSELCSCVLKVNGLVMVDELESVCENVVVVVDMFECLLCMLENLYVFLIFYVDFMILVGFIFDLKCEFW